MPKRVLPRISTVTPGDRPLTLAIGFDTGAPMQVDLTPLVATFRVLAPLAADPLLFARARRGEHGTDVVWSDEIDLSADTLWRLAQEQAGLTMAAPAFRAWRERRRLTLDEAARMLGISRRMVAYYEEGTRPIPRLVALATRGLDAA